MSITKNKVPSNFALPFSPCTANSTSKNIFCCESSVIFFVFTTTKQHNVRIPFENETGHCMLKSLICLRRFAAAAEVRCFPNRRGEEGGKPIIFKWEKRWGGGGAFSSTTTISQRNLWDRHVSIAPSSLFSASVWTEYNFRRRFLSRKRYMASQYLEATTEIPSDFSSQQKY